MAVRASIQVNSINVPLPVYGALELGPSCGRTAGPRPQRPLATTYGAINASGEPFCFAFVWPLSQSINQRYLGECPLGAEDPRWFKVSGSL